MRLNDQLRIGELRHQVSLQQNLATIDAYGGQANVWTTIATIWAAISPATGREWAGAGKIDAEVTHLVRVRYRADIVPKMRLSYGARVFNIRAIVDPDERRNDLELKCVELE